ncbi:bifunctional diguanylate cyclase/phosphodiesterase [soil metagenome]
MTEDADPAASAPASVDVLRLLVAGATDALFVIDAVAGRCVLASRSAATMLGYDEAELTGMSITDVALNIPTAEAFERRVEQLRTGGPNRREGALRRKDGTVVLTENSSRYLELDGYPYLVAISRDLTERAAADTDLRERESLLSTILDTMSEAVLVVDHKGTIVHANPQCAAILSVPPERAVGLPYDDQLFRVDGTPYAVDDQPLAQVLSTGRPVYDAVVGVGGAAGLPRTWHLVNAAPLSIVPGEGPGAVVTYTEVTDLKRTEERLRELAWSDVLTGLPNRAQFTERLRLASREASAHSVALLYMDIDGFKAVNDVFGHSFGDRLLLAVAGRLRDSLAEEDFVARLGGDEFVVVLVGPPGASMKTRAEAVAADLCRRLAAPYTIDANDLVVSVSIGITMSSTGTIDGETLLQRADMAMYAAKDAGRDTYRFFESMMDVQLQVGVRTVAAIRAGLDNQEFALYLQPIAPVDASAPTGAECLLRWERPEGTVHPSNFIEIAEDSGLIVPLGAWVMAEACRIWPLVQGIHSGGFTLAVNMSGRQFRRAGAVDDLVATLEAADCDPRLICVELTESSIMRDVRETRHRLRTLKDLGVKIAIDDFGAGYSSLNHLKELPIDVVKLDRSFVADLESDPACRAIVAAVVQMAHAMDLRVVAEGIERVGQLDFLREHGCDSYQGYLLGEGTTVSEFTRRWA